MNRIAQEPLSPTHDSTQAAPAVAEQIGPRRPGDLYTYALAVVDCPVHRKQHEEAEARYAQYGESIERRDRIQLGLRVGRRVVGGAA
jgi:hypothetical protein